MLRAILNKSRQQHPTRHQLYGHLPPITKTIKARRTRHAGHCWRSKDELISDVLIWTPAYGQAKAGQPARTYIQQLCEDTRLQIPCCIPRHNIKIIYVELPLNSKCPVNWGCRNKQPLLCRGVRLAQRVSWIWH